jgi:hypothetical protein
MVRQEWARIVQSVTQKRSESLSPSRVCLDEGRRDAIAESLRATPSP